MSTTRNFLTALVLTLPLAGANAVTFTSDTTINAGNASYDGQPIVVSGCTLTVDGPHAFASLLVTNAGWIRHPDPASNRLDFAIAGDIVVATNSFIYGNARLTVQGNVIIAPGGWLFASYRGYPIGTNSGPGAGGVSAWYGGGAGYGGNGGNGNPQAGIAPGGSAYGNPLQPADLGSPGGRSSSAGGGAGGGALRLDVAGRLTLDGMLSADGGTATYYYSYGAGGGSGGSIWITVGTLAGAGSITANGGDGDTYNGGGGGGGGRVAVYCGTNLFTGSHAAVGGNGAQAGGAGTFFLKRASESVGEILVDAGGKTGVLTPLSSASNTRLVVTNQAIVQPVLPLALTALRVESGGVIFNPGPVDLIPPQAPLNVAGDVLVRSNGAIRGNWLVTASNVTVDLGGGLSADGKGYPIGTNAGPGVGGVVGWAGGGASHGGIGGTGPASAQPGLPYGTVAEPTTLGSRGGTPSGSAGGGALRLSVAGTLTVNGRVSADGASAGSESGGGGGSGGSVWITAGALVGAGTISADGGAGDVSYWYGGGGGGGGRVAIYCNTSAFTGARHAFGGAGKGAGGAGTTLWKTGADAYGLVIMDGGGTTTPRTPVDSTLPFSLIVSNGAVVYAAQPLTLASLRVGSGGTFTHQPGTGAVNLTISGDATIDVGGSINANACGYLASTNAGPGAGVSGGGGAGHGGNGGTKYTGIKGGPAYGSTLWPTNYGSRGGDGSYGAGGAGGGVIKLIVGGTLTVNGSLSAEGGAVGIESAAGSGSGGSLLVTAHSLAGSGVISVSGGVGDYSYWYGGGGGAGGRAALWLTDSLFTGTMTAQGGAGKASGAAGTVFLKLAGEPLGTVRVDNGSITGFGPITPIAATQPVHLTLSNYALITFPQPATLGNLTLNANTWITFPANGIPLDLVVLSNATLAASAQILADGFGSPINGDLGVGAGAISNNVGSGAGHGGGGGMGSTGARGGRTYGSVTEPTTFGSQGGASSGGSGGAGGGVARMTVGGTLALQGRISANGSVAAYGNAGGGSGGSLYLTVGALTGNGLLWAMGGSGNGSGGGGGGGRISILGNVAGFNTNNILATAASGYQTGTNGSIYFGGYFVPKIVATRPAGFTTQAADHFDVDFDQGIDPASFTPALVQVTGPSGVIPTAQLSVANAGGRTWRISFPPQTSNGTVSFTVAPGVRGLFGLATANAYSGSFDIRLERYLLASRASNTLRLDWATSLGRTYQLQSGTVLTNWHEFGPAWPGTGGMIGTNIAMSGVAPTFFRLRIFE